MPNVIKIVLNDKPTVFIEINDDREESNILYGKSIRCSTCRLPIFSKTFFKTYDVKDHIRYSTFIGYSIGVVAHELCHVCFKQLQDNPDAFKFKYQQGLL